MSEVITATRIFEVPMHVAIEASDDVVIEQNLDQLRGEHIAIVHDVIGVVFDRDEVTITTARTLARPDRAVLTFPRSAFRKIRAIGPSE